MPTVIQPPLSGEAAVPAVPVLTDVPLEQENAPMPTSRSATRRTRSGTSTDALPANSHAKWHVVMIPVDSIDPNPWQPRTFFDAQEMEELTQSVKAHGVQQPVLIRTSQPASEKEESNSHPKGRAKKISQRFHLVAGERRLRASREAGKKTIPAIVRDDLSDLQVAEMAIIENSQRANLSSIEEARGYKRLMSEFHLSEERVAKKAGKSLSVVQSLLKLLVLPEGVQGLLRLKKLSAAHGHELLRLAASPEACHAVAVHVVSHQLPATSLARDVLPNARELEKKGLIIPLDYRTRFDKAGCKTCPHKAHVASGYGSYCIKPLEWKRKQEETLAREADESARVLEEARRQSEAVAGSTETEEASGGEIESTGSSLPTLSQLPRGSFRDLRFGEVPPGCSSLCPCRGCALDPQGRQGGEGEDREEAVRVPLCLDPKRFAQMQQVERARREDERRHHYQVRFESALDALQSSWRAGNGEKALALAFSPLLDGRSARGVYVAPSQWEALIRRVAERLDVALPCDQLFDGETEEGDVLRLLAGESEEEERALPGRLMLLGAGLLLAHEAEGAARWGGETPLLDFVLPDEGAMQTALALIEGQEDTDDPFDEDDSSADGEPFADDDQYMEEDFAAPSHDGAQPLAEEWVS